MVSRHTSAFAQFTGDSAIVRLDLFVRALMAYSLSEQKIHEWIGIGILLLFLIHHGLNLQWLRALSKGRYTNVDDVTSAAKEVWPNADGVVSFVNYVEGIYVGYCYYETAYAEAQTNGYDFDYISVLPPADAG